MEEATTARPSLLDLLELVVNMLHYRFVSLAKIWSMIGDPFKLVVKLDFTTC